MNPNITHFKLTARGLTRRAIFQARPTWLALSDKIHSLFNIPLDKVAVSYVDSEEDEVTMSTQEELDDFYEDLDKGGEWTTEEPIKLFVLDLSTARSQTSRSEKSLPTTPRSTAARNTFGGNLSDGLPFNIDEDWQSFPPFGNIFPPNLNVPEQEGYAHIVALSSDASVVRDSPLSSKTSSVRTPTPRPDKGKGRALDEEEEEEEEMRGLADDDDVSSILSVIDSEAQGPKPPIHVMGRPASSGLFESFKGHSSPSSRTSRQSRSRHTSLAATAIGKESTPRSSVRDLPPRTPSNVSIPLSSIPVHTAVESIPSEDPPLPALDKLSLDQASLEKKKAKASLSTDIASLLSTLTTVISTHPELSERVTHILQNAAAGSYWSQPGQRDSIQSLHDSVAEGLNSLDEEAGRQVADALGALFRTVGQAVGTSAPNAKVDSTNNGRSIPSAVPNTSPSELGGPHRRSTSETWSRPSQLYKGPDWGAYGPPPVPGGSVPPQPPRGLYSYHRTPSERPPLHHMPTTNFTAGSRSHRRPKKHSQDLRAQVEAAKLLYKAEKERYRADREERRREKEERERRLIEEYVNRGDGPHEQIHTPLADISAIHPPPVASSPLREPLPPRESLPPREPPPPADPARMISNGHGRYPSFELARVPSAPHRSSTLRRSSDTASRRVSDQPIDPTERSLKRIIRKLGDMGFTTRAHPDLPSRVRTLLPSDITTVTADKEEDIATTLVHELVRPPTIPPAASGSGGVH